MNWKKLGASLDLSDGELSGIQADNGEEYEQIYKMLKTWWQKGAAAYDNLAFVLRQHNLQETRRVYCVTEHAPPLKEDVKLRK